MQTRRRAALVATAAVLCAAAWLFLNVAGNYGGRISGLFYTGSKQPLPAEVSRHTFRTADPTGYDGQYYHLAAHDPLMRRGFAAYADNGSLRWRRVGVPAAAWLLAFGNDEAVDWTFVALQLALVFAGAFWLAQYAQAQRANAVWGLAFLAIPAVAVSLDRMTVDLALAALLIGFVLHAAGGKPRWGVYPMLALMPLVRETGMVLVAAWCVWSLFRRQWKSAALGMLSAVPAAAWWLYVRGHAQPDGTSWLSAYPFSGLISVSFGRVETPTGTLWLRAAAAFENAALIGIWAAVACALYLLWRRRGGFLGIAAILFAAFAGILGREDIWTSAYATARTMSPLLIALGLIALAERRPVFAAPLALVLPRIALQYEAQFMGAVRRLL